MNPEPITQTDTTERLSPAWRLVLAAFLVGAIVSAVRGAQELGIEGILATAISSTAMILFAAPALDLTRLPGPVGRVSRSLADGNRVWSALVGERGSRVPVTSLIVLAGLGAGVLVHALSEVAPAWLAITMVVAGVHLAYRLLLARFDARPRTRSRFTEAVTAELRSSSATATYVLDQLDEEGSTAQQVALYGGALARGLLAALGRALLLLLLALPVGWLIGSVGLVVAAVIVAPGLFQQAASRALRGGGEQRAA